MIACARTSPFVDDFGVTLADPKIVPEPTKATLCIYRPFRFGSGLASPLVLIDGESAVLLHNSGKTRIFLSPGKHSISTTYSHQWVRGNLSTIDLEVRTGQTYYLQVLAEANLVQAYTDFSLALMPEEKAAQELIDLHYLRAMDRHTQEH